MADRSEPPEVDALASAVASLTEVLTRVAAGDLDARAPRTMTGEPLDVLHFMVNATIEEVAALVTELRRERDALRAAREQLVHADKLAALGELAGALTHEMNQPLTALRAISSVLVRRSDLPAEEMRLIAEASERLARIVDGVRSFARQSSLRLQPLDPRVPFDDALRLIQPSLVTLGIGFERAEEPDLPAIQADPERLPQVFLNLLANARDAVGQRPRAPGEAAGRISLRIKQREGFVTYELSDDGPGVPETHRSRLFMPYFTTKPLGSGTGLGLSISFAIVRDHGGAIDYADAAGGGAQFSVHVPARPTR